MSQHFTKTSFIIPCSKEQALLAQEAIKFISEAEIKQGEALLSKSDEDCSLLEKLIIRMVKEHPEFNSEAPGFGDPSCPEENLNIELGTKVSEQGLNVFHEESMDVDHAIAITTAVLATFNLPHMVEISAAFVCDKASVDAFGGIVTVVTKERHWLLNRYRFSQTMNKAHADGIQYALCKVTHYQHENSYEACYLLDCKANSSAEAVALERISRLSESQAHMNTYISMDEENNIGLCLKRVCELTAFEYDGICKMIPSFDILCPVTA
ncbi:hypothetical protein FIP36_16845 [Salmonella enterica]|nr:hypothetical protein [Salmonella enterica]